MARPVAMSHREPNDAHELREHLMTEGVLRRWSRGQHLVRKGDVAGAVYLVERGSLKVTTCTEDGDEAIHAVLGPGELIGELAAVDGRPHAADVVALTDGDGRQLSTERFRAILAEDVGNALAVAAVLASRIRAADEARLDSVTGDVLTRVARRLWNLSNDLVPDGSGEIRVSTSQDDLARWCGASRQAVNGALARLQTAGLVRTGRGAIFVLDRERLPISRTACDPT